MNFKSFDVYPTSILSRFKYALSNGLFLMLLLFLPTHAYAFDDTGIEVTGQGSLVVTPDQFSLTLTVTERGSVPSKLKALVDNKSNSVISAANNLKVKDSNISSARVNLRIIEEKPSIQVQGVELRKAKQGSVFIDGQDFSQQINPNKSQKKPLFELSRQITVNFNNIDDYDNFLAQIIKIKVSHISSLSMSVSERDEYYQQALLQAINHAKYKAERMAKQAGASLGKLRLVKELSSNHYRPMYAEAMMSDSSSSTHTSLIGSHTITARVSVKFSLED
jgi:uncharacterized protein YggE